MFRIAVVSGKGGTGKTTVACSLARELAPGSGILDLDFKNPNVPRAMRIDQSGPFIEAETRSLIPVEKDGVEVWSLGFVLPEGKPLMWSGDRIYDLVREHKERVVWKNAKALVVDMPAGSGDEIKGLLELDRPQCAVLITIPADLAYDDYLRARDMVEHYKIPIAGIVVNMAYIAFPDGTKKKLWGDFTFPEKKNVIVVPYTDSAANDKSIPLPQLKKKILRLMGEYLKEEPNVT